ncbi:MAG: glycerate kinase [Planctomycetes bacterium]|nr:glycerate kinase [Planctomycetota bacterium]
MKIVIAPNAFKECLTAEEVVRAVAHGIRQIIPHAQIVSVPIADGGDGTLPLLLQSTRGRIFRKKVSGPRGRKKVSARWGLLGQNCAVRFSARRTVIIEMAEAAGLKLLPPTQRDPLRTRTTGVGELIKAALDKKARQIIIGLGGSATVDGATGLAQALGIKFLDARGKPVKPTGGSLNKIKHIDASGLDRRCRKIKIIAACDVTNPLIGPRGAARTFASQKGADAQAVKILERNLAHLGRIIKKDLGVGVAYLKGGGAAGGCGAGLAAFLKARLVSGADLFLEIIDLPKKLENTDLVITGEGTLDQTTLAGKAPASLARAVKKYNKKIPVIALGGKLGPGYRRLSSAGIDACFSISPKGMSRQQSIKNAGKLIENRVSVIIKNGFFKK